VTAAYFNAIANYARSLITHIGLITPTGAELTGPNYHRQVVTWTIAEDGEIAPTADLLFQVPGSVTVAGWHGYSSATGGTDYGGEALMPESFNGSGEYLLQAVGTGIVHRASRR
jgi:hypothetical protein